jgi:Mrp family chromosome partitioning ATPase
VLIDTPALLGVADAVAIAAQADGVVLVVNRGIPLDLLREVRDRLAFVDTPLLGYISTAARPRPLAMPGTTVSPGARKLLGRRSPPSRPAPTAQAARGGGGRGEGWRAEEDDHG